MGDHYNDHYHHHHDGDGDEDEEDVVEGGAAITSFRLKRFLHRRHLDEVPKILWSRDRCDIKKDPGEGSRKSLVDCSGRV